jgi:AraC family ethanolamine operon transcriptional activator
MRTRRAIVECAEAYLRSQAGQSVRVSALCEFVGLSERGLRNAFYDVHGQGPKQWMLHMRLREVRQALSEARNGTPTVTSIATEHGFFDLGRFAASYRQAFGEAPSETLRAAVERLSCAGDGAPHEVPDVCRRTAHARTQ